MFDQLRADLELAAREVERRGHTQGEFMSRNGRVCTMQALMLATGVGLMKDGTRPYRNERFNAARDAVEQDNEVAPFGVCEWNNQHGRTGAQVAAKLRGVAERLAAGSGSYSRPRPYQYSPPAAERAYKARSLQEEYIWEPVLPSEAIRNCCDELALVIDDALAKGVSPWVRLAAFWEAAPTADFTTRVLGRGVLSDCAV